MLSILTVGSGRTGTCTRGSSFNIGSFEIGWASTGVVALLEGGIVDRGEVRADLSDKADDSNEDGAMTEISQLVAADIRL